MNNLKRVKLTALGQIEVAARLVGDYHHAVVDRCWYLIGGEASLVASSYVGRSS